MEGMTREERAAYFTDAAKRLEIQAARLMAEANRFRELAETLRTSLPNEDYQAQAAN